MDDDAPLIRRALTLGDVVDEADPELARFLASRVVDLREQPPRPPQAPSPQDGAASPAAAAPPGSGPSPTGDTTGWDGAVPLVAREAVLPMEVATDALAGLVADHSALRDLLDAVGVGIMRWDLDGGTAAWSDAAYRAHGRARWRRVRHAVDGLASVHPDDIAAVRAEWQRLHDEPLAEDVVRWGTITYRTVHDDGGEGVVRCDGMATLVGGRRSILAVCRDITAEHEASARLTAQLEFLHAVLATTPDSVLVFDIGTGRVVSDATGRPRPDWPTAVHPDDADLHRSWMRSLAGLVDDEVRVVTLRLRAEDAEWRWYDVRAVAFGGGTDEAPTGQALVVLRSVHEETEVAQQLAASEARFRLLFDRTPVAQAIVDADGRFHEVNDALCELLGRDRTDLLDTVVEAVVQPEHRAEVHSGRETGGSVEWRMLHGAGQELWCRVRCSALELDGSPRTLMAFADITATKHTEAHLRHEAMHDGLTGLPNRKLLTDRLDTALARARRGDGDVAVYFIDLDDLKRVNDTLGHDAGDELLLEVSRSVRAALRDEDTLGRLGGDEFVAICEGVEGELAAADLGRRLLAAACRTVSLRGQRVAVTSSVGMALADVGRDTAEDVLRRADTAMYGAKMHGGGRLGAPDRPAAASGRTELERDLRAALAEDRLLLHYQPVVGMAGDLRGVEALLRWPHPERGLVPAAELLDLLEAGDLAVPLAEWAAARAVRDLSGVGLDALPVRVNVPARALLRPQVGLEISRALAATGRDPGTLVLEVRETDVAPLVRRGAAIRALDACGASLGLDRFGADSAPLAMLRRLPLSTVTLDRSLLTGAVESPADAALLRAVVAAAETLGIVTIALGVETSLAVDVAREAGVDTLQGFRVGVPVPPGDLPGLVRVGRRPLA